jgi:hypothetical protein
MPQRKKSAAEKQREREAEELRRFTEEYVQAGGNPFDAPKKWQEHQRERAHLAALRGEG